MRASFVSIHHMRLCCSLSALFLLGTLSVAHGQPHHHYAYHGGNYAYHGGNFRHGLSQPSLAAPRPIGPLARAQHPDALNPSIQQLPSAVTGYPSMATSRQSQIGQPNIFIHVTAGALISRMQQQRVTREPIYDVILGTSLQGKAISRTSVTPQLIPSDRGIEIALHLHTRAFTKAVGTNSAATAYNRGVTEIQGRKQILFTPTQFFTNNAQATANTQSDIIGFQWSRHFGERIARDRAAQQKPLAEEVSARKAADRARMQFDRLVDKQVLQFENQYRAVVQQQLALLPQQPRHLRFRSTAHTLVAEATFGNGIDNQIANRRTPNLPPTLQINGSCQGMALQIHESLISDSLFRLNNALAGRSLDEKDWAGLLAEFLPASTPEETQSLKVGNNRRPWTLGMPKQRPLQVAMTSRGLQVSLKIDSFQVGKSKYPGMLIESLYLPAITEGKIVAQRSEKLQLTPLDEDGNKVTPTSETKKTAAVNSKDSKNITDKTKTKTKTKDKTTSENPATKKKPTKGRLGIRQQVFRSMVRKRFDPIFAKEIPLGERIRTIAGNQVSISRIELANGWATVQAVTE